MIWDSLESLVRGEIRQRLEEGCDVSGFEQQLEQAKGDRAALEALYDRLDSLQVQPSFPYKEPNGIDEIFALADTKPDEGFKGSREELYDRLYGAWLGRCAGCALGKPFEFFPYVCGKDGKPGYHFVAEWLKGADAYPLTGYVPAKSRAIDDGLGVIFPDSLRENIRFMETDDDIRYLVLALVMGEQKGNDFTPDDVAMLWQSNLPIRMLFTAEIQAYINSINTEIADPEERYAYYAQHHNPFREWIGAQIRIDHYAYANACSPKLAARVAWQDARFSHTKNGLYGAMFCAAAIAQAFSGGTVESCVQAGLSVIPKTSRMYEAVLQSAEIAKKATDEESLYRALWDKFGCYHHVHAINNTAACVAALLFGKGDFTRTIATAVCVGWDTDCNGATVGSIMGALLGAKALPKEWTEPLHDTLYSAIPNFHPAAISDCAQRSLALFSKLHPEQAQG